MTKQVKAKKLGIVLVGAMTTVLFLSSGAVSSAQSPSNTVPAHSSTGTSPAASASPVTTTLQSPAIPGVSPLPGPVADPAQPSNNMGILDVTPDQGVAGAPVTISGSPLPSNARLSR